MINFSCYVIPDIPILKVYKPFFGKKDLISFLKHNMCGSYANYEDNWWWLRRTLI